ncbi:MAG: hypothetical protein E4H07_06240 [Nitrosomonadales bacterium]|nr:MAG: hypothetical protein E4H07_06240 [Nitrosomonadales bacterium]
MENELIEDYRIGWNFQKNNGGFAIKKKGGSRFNKVNIDTFQELMVVATILNGKKKAFYNSKTKVIGTVGFEY